MSFFTLDALVIAAVLLITIAVMGGWFEHRRPPR